MVKLEANNAAAVAAPADRDALPAKMIKTEGIAPTETPGQIVVKSEEAEHSLKRTASSQETLQTQSLPPKRLKFDYSETVKVIVSKNDMATTFQVPQLLLCQNSAFFNAACSGDWKEAAERSISLPSTDPDFFQIYLHWLYTHSVRPKELTATEHDTADRSLERIHKFLIDLFCLADFLQDSGLAETAFQSLLQAIKSSTGSPYRLSLQSINRTYGKTSAGSPLRALIVNGILNFTSADWYRTSIARLPTDLVQELSIALMKLRDEDPKYEVWKQRSMEAMSSIHYGPTKARE